MIGLSMGLGLGPRGGGGESGPRIFLIGSHGDSRLGGVYAADPPSAYPADRAYQFVTASEATEYSLAAGINADMFPLANPVSMQASGAAVIPMHYAIAELLDSGSDFYLGDEAIVVYCGGGWNGSSVVDTGGGTGTLGPLPASVTAYNVDKWEDARAAVAANWPTATIIECIVIVDVTNDAASDPDDVHDAQVEVFADLRSVTGFSGAPLVNVSMCPEYNTLGGVTAQDRANRVATLEGTNTFWCQLPTGVGQQHEGEVGGEPDETVGIAAAGLVYAASIAIALGAATPDAFTPSFDTTPEIEEGSSADIVALNANKKAIWTVHSGFGGTFAVTDPMDSDAQGLQFVGGTAPAYTGTGADNIACQLDYRDADGLTGTVSLTVTVTEDAGVSYLIQDDGTGNGAVSGRVAGGTLSAVWSGDGTTSGGKFLPTSNIDTTVNYKEVECDITVGAPQSGGHQAYVFMGFNDSPGDYIYWNSYGNTGHEIAIYHDTLGALILDDAGEYLSAGTYHLKLQLNADNTFKVFVDSVEKLSGTHAWLTDLLENADVSTLSFDEGASGHAGLLFDNITVLDLTP